MLLEEMANYATIILALAMVNVVWQLDKAGKLLMHLQKILVETSEDYHGRQ